MAYKVVDISQWNGVIDWDKVKKEVDGAIIRAGYRGYGAAGSLATDAKFDTNMSEAIAAGIPVGVYWLSQALSETEAKEEAAYLIKLVKKYKITYPIYLDSEYGEVNEKGRADKLDKTTRTKFAKAFLKAIKSAGYTAGLYCSEWWFGNDIDGQSICNDGYTVWIANISNKPKVSKYDAWQYTWKGKISGINGDVDVSHFYKNFTQKTTNQTTAKKKTVDQIAKEVIDGKWGVGEERKKKLTAAGYNYTAVQAKVNALVNTKTYFKKPNYKGVSFVEALTAIGVKTTFTYRKKIATANGIKNYNGTAVQNTKLLDLLKKGKLIKP